jgi:hypothetical protein
MRIPLLSIVLLFLVAGFDPASARVFQGPGWYIVNIQFPSRFEATSEGPFADEAQCQARLAAEYSEEDQEDAFDIGIGFNCKYLSNAMPSDT